MSASPGRAVFLFCPARTILRWLWTLPEEGAAPRRASPRPRSMQRECRRLSFQTVQVSRDVMHIFIGEGGNYLLVCGEWIFQRNLHPLFPLDAMRLPRLI